MSDLLRWEISWPWIYITSHIASILRGYFVLCNFNAMQLRQLCDEDLPPTFYILISPILCSYNTLKFSDFNANWNNLMFYNDKCNTCIWMQVIIKCDFYVILKLKIFIKFSFWQTIFFKISTNVLLFEEKYTSLLLFAEPKRHGQRTLF